MIDRSVRGRVTSVAALRVPAFPELLSVLPGAALFLAFLVPGAAAGQEVTGKVLDGVTGAPVVGAEVAVLGAGGEAVGLAVSDSVGAFHTRIAEAGSYRVVATAPGYDSLAVDSLEVGETEDVWVELRLGPRPFDVEGLTVVGRRLIGPPGVRDFHRRRERHEKTGFGMVLDREVLEQHAVQTAARVVARESPQVRETGGLGGGGSILMKRRVVRFGESQWCTPAFFLDGVRVDAITIRATPASTLEGIEVYRGLTQVPPQYSMAPGARSCGAILAWSRRDAERKAFVLRSFHFGPVAAGSVDGRDEGVALDGVGVEIDRGIERSLVGWVQAALGPGASDDGCPTEAGVACREPGPAWSAIAGVSIFPVESHHLLAPYFGGGLGVGSAGEGAESVHLLRVGLEVVTGQARLRLELRRTGDGPGAGVGLMF